MASSRPMSPNRNGRSPRSVRTGRPLRLTLRGRTPRLAVRARLGTGDHAVESTDTHHLPARDAWRAQGLRAGGPARSRRSFGPTSSRGSSSGGQVFPGVVGYEDSVVPAIENAILAGHDLVFLGERGQAKTRIARLLVGLLDPWLPAVRGGELNDDPLRADQPGREGHRRARWRRDRRSTGSRATGATPRSSRPPTSPSPT